MVGFNEPWHAEMIERFSPQSSEDGPTEMDNLARAILAAACILSQSVDELRDVIKESKS